MATIWNFPTRILFGLGESRNIGNEVKALSASRALLVTDRGIEAAGLVEPIARALEQVGVAVACFCDVEPNPSEANVAQGAEALAQHRADVIVGLGGGSPLDAAKLIAVRAAVALPFEALDDAKGGDRFIPTQLLPVIAVPTTAGTGSEVGRAGVVGVAGTGRKTVIFSPAMLPRVAILDPELTRTMPKMTTAATGFDALTHCMEARVAIGDHPMADGIAEKGMSLVAKYLLRAVEDGDDLEARGAMMKAAMMGAVAFQKGLGACHSLAHPLSSEHDVHHGLANAICLPAVVRFNMEQAEDGYVSVARCLDIDDPQELPDKLAVFRSRLGLPNGLGEVGVQRADLSALSALAVEDGCHQGNPRRCDRAALEQLYLESL